MQKLYIFDGHSNIYQAYYAIRNMSNSKGMPTNAVFGFISMLNKVLREKSPDYVAIVFDSDKPTFRHEQFAGYKATRKPMPDDLVPQIDWIFKTVKALGIASYMVEGYEADDIIATLARRAEKSGVETFVVTRDKDLKQIISDTVKLYDSRNDTVYTVNSLREELGLSPRQFVDALALAGDSTDNIPGVPGIGLKTGAGLIKEFGSIEDLYENIDHVKGKKRENLLTNKEVVKVSKQLVTVDDHVPVDIDVEALRPSPPDIEKLTEIYGELDFSKFLSELTSARNNSSPPEAKNLSYELVASEAALDDLVELLQSHGAFCFDIETTSRSPMMAEIVGISFCVREDEAFYIPVEGPQGSTLLDKSLVLEKLKSLLEDPSIGKIGQNLKYDMLVLKNHNIEVRGVVFDTMVASYLINPGRRQHNLDLLAQEYLNYKMTSYKELTTEGKEKRALTDIDVNAVKDYSCEDADVAFKLKNVLEPLLRDNNVIELFQNVEIPLIYCLCELEYNGVSIDTDVLSEMSKELAEKIESLEKEIYHQAGEEFNIGSPKQLSHILFEKLNLPVQKKTKTGFSTDSGVLDSLAKLHPIVAMIVEYRMLAKLKSTYVDALPRFILADTGKIHASFNQTVTETGRLSSSDPNLQNIPIRGDLGRSIRRAFIPSAEGNVLLTADYSQIELRILSHFSQDPQLKEAFEKGLDIHSFVASLIYGVDESAVEATMRRMAKTVNFGIMYGLSPFGLSKQLNISVGEATDFISSYFARFAGVQTFFEKLLTDAKQDGYVTTILNRRRYVEGIKNVSGLNRTMAERVAINTVIQGSAADLIKVAMNNIHAKLVTKEYQAKMILQIHDELIFDLPEDSVDDQREMIVHEMTRAIDFNVPIKVDVAVGKNWMEAK